MHWSSKGLSNKNKTKPCFRGISNTRQIVGCRYRNLWGLATDYCNPVYMAHHHGAELNARVTLECVISMGAVNEGGKVGTIPSRPAAQEDPPWTVKKRFLFAPRLLLKHCSLLRVLQFDDWCWKMSGFPESVHIWITCAVARFFLIVNAASLIAA